MEFGSIHRDNLALCPKLSGENDPHIQQMDYGFLMEFSSSSHVPNRVLNNLDHFSVDGSLSNPSYGFYPSCYDPFDPFQASFGKLNQEFSNVHGPFGHESAVNGHVHENNGGFFDHLSNSRVLLHEVPLHYRLNEPLDFQTMSSLDENRVEKDSCLIMEENENRNAKRKIKEVVHTRKKRVIEKKSEIVKGQWTPDEDRLLVELVKKHGIRKWSTIAQMLSGRIGKQCRERWHNHLKPDIKKDRWSDEEDRILIESHRQLGNKWAEIARSLPGRSENTIKNHWNATKRRQLSSRKNGNSKPNTPLQNYIKSVISTSSDDKECHSSSGSISPGTESENAAVHASFKIPPALDTDQHMQFDLQKEMDFMEMLSYGYI